MTKAGLPVDTELLHNYFTSLVNRFFKILPMRDDGEATLPVYMHSLQVELIGCSEFAENVAHDPSFMTLLSLLQYMIGHLDCDNADMRREVFHAISICKKLAGEYAESEVAR